MFDTGKKEAGSCGIASAWFASSYFWSTLGWQVPASSQVPAVKPVRGRRFLRNRRFLLDTHRTLTLFCLLMCKVSAILWPPRLHRTTARCKPMFDTGKKSRLISCDSFGRAHGASVTVREKGSVHYIKYLIHHVKSVKCANSRTHVCVCKAGLC